MTHAQTFRAYRAGDEIELARLEALVEPTPWTAGDFLDVPKTVGLVKSWWMTKD